MTYQDVAAPVKKTVLIVGGFLAALSPVFWQDELKFSDKFSSELVFAQVLSHFFVENLSHVR